MILQQHLRLRLPTRNATAASSCAPKSDVPVQMTTIAPLVYHLVRCVTVETVMVVKEMTKVESHPKLYRLVRLGWRTGLQTGFEGFRAEECWQGRE